MPLLEKALSLILAASLQLGVSTCGGNIPPQQTPEQPSGSLPDTAEGTAPSEEGEAFVTAGTQTGRGFLLDNVLHDPQEGDIHYNVYIPDSYDESEPYAVFFTLPGYEGL